MRYLIIFTFTLWLYPTLIFSLEPDYEAYGEILTNYLTYGEKNEIHTSLIDYKNLKSSNLIKDAIQEIVSFDISLLDSEEEEIAFYINTYNLHILDVVTDNWPINSIKELSKWNLPIWKKKIINLNGKMLSLDELEHFLIKQYSEPKIHFALNCASISCPDLLATPYVGKILYEQLENQTSTFLNNHTKGFNIENNTLKISKIFKWYKGDFSGESSLMNLSTSILNIDFSNYNEIDYLIYDWGINSLDHEDK